MWKAVLLLGSTSLVSATIPTIGPCIVNIKAEKIDFDEFASANGGVWSFSKVTDTPNNSQFKSLQSVTKPTNKQGVYELVIYYSDKSGKSGIFANETEYAPGSDGVVIAKGNDFVYTLNISFLKYEPGSYAYYYICSDDGGDTTADYRYVVSTKKLTEKESSNIEALDKKLNFKGNLVNI